jgi:hypothetical protein
MSNLTDEEIIQLVHAVDAGRCTVQYAVDVILLGPADWQYTPSCPCDQCEDWCHVMGMKSIYGRNPRPTADERPHRTLKWPA